MGICINNTSKILNYRLLNNWLEIKTIDLHTESEPLRMIIKGYLALKCKTILEKRKFVKNKFDNIRRALILEPRGHSDMYGAIITEPVTKEVDIEVIFIHNNGYSTGCRHAVIPEVQKSANIIGKNSFWIDPQDKNEQGFILK